MRVIKSDLINKPEKRGRHVVIVGAGASVAAFPKGDANRKILPTMDNLIEVLGTILLIALLVATFVNKATVAHSGH